MQHFPKSPLSAFRFLGLEVGGIPLFQFPTIDAEAARMPPHCVGGERFMEEQDGR